MGGLSGVGASVVGARAAGASNVLKTLTSKLAALEIDQSLTNSYLKDLHASLTATVNGVSTKADAATASVVALEKRLLAHHESVVAPSMQQIISSLALLNSLVKEQQSSIKAATTAASDASEGQESDGGPSFFASAAAEALESSTEALAGAWTQLVSSLSTAADGSGNAPSTAVEPAGNGNKASEGDGFLQSFARCIAGAAALGHKEAADRCITAYARQAQSQHQGQQQGQKQAVETELSAVPSSSSLIAAPSHAIVEAKAVADDTCASQPQCTALPPAAAAAAAQTSVGTEAGEVILPNPSALPRQDSPVVAVLLKSRFSRAVLALGRRLELFPRSYSPSPEEIALLLGVAAALAAATSLVAMFVIAAVAVVACSCGRAPPSSFSSSTVDRTMTTERAPARKGLRRDSNYNEGSKEHESDAESSSTTAAASIISSSAVPAAVRKAAAVGAGRVRASSSARGNRPSA